MPSSGSRRRSSAAARRSASWRSGPGRPAASTPTQFLLTGVPAAQLFTVASTSGLAVGVPGTLAALDTALHRWGTTSLRDAVAPAAEVAEKGFRINRFLAAISHAVIEAGGQPNQFLGDGLLALFGLASSPATACRQALQAAALIAANVGHLNRQLADDHGEPIRFGIGIHAGEVIVGDIGYRDHRVFTALGDAVNVAARLQDLTKGLDCEVVFSDEVRRTAGLASDALPSTEVTIRGRTEPMVVRTAAHAASLSALLAPGTPAAASA